MTEEHKEETLPERAPAAAAPGRSWAGALALLVALAVAAGGVLLWLDTRERIRSLQEETALRLREVQAAASEAQESARQALEGLRESQARAARLEEKLAQSQSDRLSVEALYQELSRNRDEWMLAEIEQVLAIASQQLQLAGNVRAALLALQFADSRLAKADRPQFQSLRRAIARDIERLRALPDVDVPSLSARLESLVAAVDEMPLAFEAREPATAARPPAPPQDAGFWTRLATEVWSEIRELVTVRRLDGAEPPLLAPPQAYFLRENLRLRLLNARLSLLARDEAGWREGLRVAQDWIERYFDVGAKRTAEALALLRQLATTTLTFEVPALSESLEAVRVYKSRREAGQ